MSGSAAAERLEAEHQMHLLGVAALAELAADIARRVARAPAPRRGRAANWRLHHLEHVVVTHIAGAGHDHAGPARNCVPMKRGQVSRREAAHQFGRAQHRAADRLVGIGGGLEMIEDDVVGRVDRLGDLLHHHFLLARQLIGVERRVLQDVGQDVEGQRHVLLQHLGVIGGMVARGVGVDIAADRLDLLGDLARAAPRRALEGHVLEHVRHAVDVGRLVARAGIDPYAHRGGLHGGTWSRRHRHAVVRRVTADVVGAHAATFATERM